MIRESRADISTLVLAIPLQQPRQRPLYLPRQRLLHLHRQLPLYLRGLLRLRPTVPCQMAQRINH
jgi:hypothetical protein